MKAARRYIILVLPLLGLLLVPSAEASSVRDVGYRCYTSTYLGAYSDQDRIALENSFLAKDVFNQKNDYKRRPTPEALPGQAGLFSQSPFNDNSSPTSFSQFREYRERQRLIRAGGSPYLWCNLYAQGKGIEKISYRTIGPDWPSSGWKTMKMEFADRNNILSSLKPLTGSSLKGNSLRGAGLLLVSKTDKRRICSIYVRSSGYRLLAGKNRSRKSTAFGGRLFVEALPGQACRLQGRGQALVAKPLVEFSLVERGESRRVKSAGPFFRGYEEEGGNIRAETEAITIPSSEVNAHRSQIEFLLKRPGRDILVKESFPVVFRQDPEDFGRPPVMSRAFHWWNNGSESNNGKDNYNHWQDWSWSKSTAKGADDRTRYTCYWYHAPDNLTWSNTCQNSGYHSADFGSWRYGAVAFYNYFSNTGGPYYGNVTKWSDTHTMNLVLGPTPGSGPYLSYQSLPWNNSDGYFFTNNPGSLSRVYWNNGGAHWAGYYWYNRSQSVASDRRLTCGVEKLNEIPLFIQITNVWAGQQYNENWTQSGQSCGTGVSPSTNGIYKVWAYNYFTWPRGDAGTGAPSNEVFLDTVAPGGSPSANLAAPTVNPNATGNATLNLSFPWENYSSSGASGIAEANYRLEKASWSQSNTGDAQRCGSWGEVSSNDGANGWTNNRGWYVSSVINTATPSGLDTGCYRWRTYSKDRAGNNDYSSYSGVLRVDRSDPAVGNLSVTRLSSSSGDFDLTVPTREDTDSGVQTTSFQTATLPLSATCTPPADGNSAWQDKSYSAGVEYVRGASNACRFYKLKVTNGVGSTIERNLTVSIDNSLPTGGSVVPGSLTNTTGSVPLTIQYPDDVESGIKKRGIRIERANYTDGTCSSSWSVVQSIETSAASYTATGLSEGCYRFRSWAINNGADDVESSRGYSPLSSVVKVDPSSPVGGSMLPGEPIWWSGSGDPQTILMSPWGDAHSGIQNVLQRRSATLSGGSCSSWGSWADVSSPFEVATFSSLVNFSSLDDAKCYQWRVKGTNGLQTESISGSVEMRIDKTAPQAGSLTAPSSSNGGSVTIGVSSGSDAQSAVKEQELQKRFAEFNAQGNCPDSGSSSWSNWSNTGWSSGSLTATNLDSGCHEWRLRTRNNTDADSFSSVARVPVSLFATLAQATDQADPSSSRPIRFRLQSDIRLDESSVGPEDFSVSGGRISNIKPVSMPAKSNLLGHWPMDGPARVARDISGKGNDLINASSAGGYALERSIGGFSSLYNVASDPDGNLYVSDYGAGLVRVFSPDGTALTSRNISIPNNALAFGIDVYGGDVYLTFDHRVVVYGTNGAYKREWGSYGCGTAANNFQFCHPRSIKVNSLGEVHVADQVNHRIQVYSTAGAHLRTIGTTGTASSADGRFNEPVGIDIDKDNNIYVAEFSNHRVQKLDRFGNFLMKFGTRGTAAGQLSYPAGMALDRDGNIYVTERGDGTTGHRIQKFGPSGNHLAMFGSLGSGTGQFLYPHGSYVDKNGTIFVADSDNRRLQIWKPAPAAVVRGTTNPAFAWGSNNLGQLGNGTQTNSSSPVEVNNRFEWSDLDAGGWSPHSPTGSYSLGISEGGVYAWGSNRAGATGLGTNSGQTLSPTLVSALSAGCTDVEAGYYHSAAICEGKLYTWGGNNTGQLGLGDGTERTAPVQVGRDTDWEEISVGEYHNLAIRDGKLYSWGANWNGQIGDGSTDQRSLPVQIGNDSDWQHVAAGHLSSFAIRDGKLYSWGDNSHGELGIGTQANKLSPVQVGSLENWSQVSSGVNFTLGIRGGELWGWGSNGQGRLGDGTTQDRLSPVRIGSRADWQTVSAGENFSLGLRAGRLFAWGDNTYGQLGDGTTTQKLEPTAIGIREDWSIISAGGRHSLASRPSASTTGGSGMRFQGTGTSPDTANQLAVTSASIPSSITNATVGGWVRFGLQPDANWTAVWNLGGNYASTNRILSVWRRNTDNALMVQSRSSSSSSFSECYGPQIPANTWRHVLAVRDGTAGQLRIYIDGQLVSSCSIPTGSTVSSGQNLFRVGVSEEADGTFPYSFAGQMSNVALWDKALTAAEVSEVFSAPSAYEVSVEPDASGAVSVEPSAQFTVKDTDGRRVLLAPGTDRTVQFSGAVPKVQVGARIPYSDSWTSLGANAPSISGYSGNVRVHLRLEGSEMRLQTTSGLTQASGYSGWTNGTEELVFEGSQSAANTALATLQVRAGVGEEIPEVVMQLGTGSASTTAGQFNNPGDVDFDSSGNIYVADTTNHRIQKFNSAGTHLATLGGTASGTTNTTFNRPVAIEVDGNNNIYVADIENSRIQKYSSSGSTFTHLQTIGSGQLSRPHDVAVDSSGNIYVANSSGNNIRVFNSAGTPTGTLGSLGSGNGQFNTPYGIAVDASGNIYVADALNNRIQKFDSSFNRLATWGGTAAGTAAGQFNTPTDVEISPKGEVWVVDQNNYRVQKLDPTSGASLAMFGGYQDESKDENKMVTPFGMALDSSGDLWLADYSGHRVQKFDVGQSVRPAGDDARLEVWATRAGAAYNPDTDTYYRASTAGGQSWLAVEAENTPWNGMEPYTFTLGSRAEMDFVQKAVSGAASWLGGSDRIRDGRWVWTGGPEAGTPFWLGQSTGSPAERGTAPRLLASGGSSSVIYNDGSWYGIHRFERMSANSVLVGDSSFTPERNLNIDYLIVGGGGGGGGAAIGGGGGAGGVLRGSLKVRAGQEYSIRVGRGGTGGRGHPNPQQRGDNGEDTTAFGLRAFGGGGGGAYCCGDTRAASPGGSGGGASFGGASLGARGVAGQGNSGGNAWSGNVAGGGGGAGAAGQNAPASNVAGAGGAGISSSISGSLQWYAGGGGGGANIYISGATAGAGASGIGGNGTNTSVKAGDGMAHTGSGGGGAGYNADSNAILGGTGGSGTVIVRYPIKTGASFANWGAGEPNNAGGRQDCATAYWSQGYWWDDGGCDYTGYPGIYEYGGRTDETPQEESFASAELIYGSGSSSSGAINVNWTSSPTSPTASESTLYYNLSFTWRASGSPAAIASSLESADFSNLGSATGCSFSVSTQSSSSVQLAVSSCSEGTLVPTVGREGEGGQKRYIYSGGQEYALHTFRNSGEISLPKSFPVEYLIVGGGGGGGNPVAGVSWEPGGGGAGGFLSGTSTVSAGTYPIEVGRGGLTSTRGESSSWNGFTAIGGGAGGNGNANGGSGGSGGGGAHPQTPGGAGTAGQGFAGENGGDGAWRVNVNGSGGGGGGASEVGGTDGWGHGGDGRVSAITGREVVYAGGGGAHYFKDSTATGNNRSSGLGGAGGGGNGAVGTNEVAGGITMEQTDGDNGTDGLGGGGGGAFRDGQGGRGGSGVVILRYPVRDFRGNVGPETILDRSAPEVSEWSLVSPEEMPADVGQVEYEITFSEDVNGLAAADFTLGSEAGEGVRAWTISSIQGSGSGPYTIAVSGTARGVKIKPVLLSGSVSDNQGYTLQGDETGPEAEIILETPPPKLQSEATFWLEADSLDKKNGEAVSSWPSSSSDLTFSEAHPDRWPRWPTCADCMPRLWIDASNNQSLNLSGDSVTSVVDKSSQRNDVSQTTSSAQPTRAYWGNRSVLSFDGNDFLEDSKGSYPGNLTVIAVAKNNGSDAGHERILNGVHNGDYRLFFGAFGSNFSTFIGNGTSWNDTGANSPARSFSQPSILSSVVSGTSVSSFVNGTAQNVKTGASAMPSFTGMRVGGFTGGQNFTGELGEVLVFPTALSSDQRQMVEAYLAKKWSLPLEQENTFSTNGYEWCAPQGGACSWEGGEPRRIVYGYEWATGTGEVAAGWTERVMKSPAQCTNEAFGDPRMAQNKNCFFAPTSSLPAPRFIDRWGSLGSAKGQFNFPMGVSVDSQDNVYVTDMNNHRIQKFSASGLFLMQIGTGVSGAANNQFNNPRGIDVDSAGNIYVADFANNRIQKFNSSGTYLNTFGSLGTGNTQLNSPSGIEVDSAGNMYIADFGNNRVLKWGPTGNHLTTFGSPGSGAGQLSGPYGIELDSDGNLYVAESNNHRIQKFNKDGQSVLTVGSLGAGDGRFNVPRDIALDDAGNIYVSERDNHRIQVLDSAGKFLTKLGFSGSADGQQNWPHGIDFDSLGNLYVADANHRIQKLGPARQPHYVANAIGGQPAVRFDGDDGLLAGGFYGEPFTILAVARSNRNPWIDVGAAGAPAYQNGWVRYDSNWPNASFYKDSNGTVHLRGLIRSGTAWSTAFTLPEGYRPSESILVNSEKNPNVADRINISANGNVGIDSYAGDNGWASLSGISFKAAGAQWKAVGAAGNAAFSNDWGNYGGGWAPAAYMKDSDGRVHLQGLIKKATAWPTCCWGAGNVAFVLPAGFRPAEIVNLRLRIGEGNAEARVDIAPSGEVVVQPNTGQGGVGGWWWLSLSGVSFPAADEVNWRNVGDTGNPGFNTSPAWGNADPGHAKAGFYKDPATGRVYLKGYVNGGAAGTIFTLPQGYRPVQNELFQGGGRVDVYPSGAVYASSGGIRTLEHISFLAAGGDGTRVENYQPFVHGGSGCQLFMGVSPQGFYDSNVGAPANTCWSSSGTGANGNNPEKSMTSTAIVSMSSDGRTIRPFWNGTAQNTRTGGMTDFSGMTIGGLLSKDGTDFSGDIAEVIYFSNVLSAEERKYLEGYLANKYGLKGYLPSDHPYKTEQPEADGQREELWTPAMLKNNDGTSALAGWWRPEELADKRVWNGRFNFSQDGAFSADGNRFFAPDREGDRIQVFDAQGNFIREWGTGGSAAGEFDWPWDAAVGSNGNVYVADSRNSRVQAFKPNGEFLFQFGRADSSPQHLAVAPNGEVFVSDSKNNRIDVYSASGSYLRRFEAQGAGGAYSLEIDQSGDVFLVDSGACRLERFNSGGQREEVFDARCENGEVLRDVALGTGEIYLGYGGSGVGGVDVIDTSGRLRRAFARSGANKINDSHGIALSPNKEELWVADSANNRILRFSAAGRHLKTIGGIALNFSGDRATWPDASGNNRPLIAGQNPQASGYQAPPKVTRKAINGYNVAEFDGTANGGFGQSLETNYTVNWPYSFYYIGRMTPSPGTNTPQKAGRLVASANAGSNWLLGYHDNNQDRFFTDNGWWLNQPQTPATTDWNIYGAIGGNRHPSWSNTWNAFVKNGKVIASSAAAYTNVNAPRGLSFGGSGVNTGIREASSGQVAEAVLVQSNLSFADRMRLEGYLAWKFNRQETLPDEHPYREEPPTVTIGVGDNASKPKIESIYPSPSVARTKDSPVRFRLKMDKPLKGMPSANDFATPGAPGSWNVNSVSQRTRTYKEVIQETEPAATFSLGQSANNILNKPLSLTAFGGVQAGNSSVSPLQDSGSSSLNSTSFNGSNQFFNINSYTPPAPLQSAATTFGNVSTSIVSDNGQRDVVHTMSPGYTHQRSVGGFNNLYTIADDSAGNLYVPDYSATNSRVQVFSPDGTYLRQFSTQTQGGGNLNYGIDVYGGEVYLVFDHRVMVYGTDGTYKRQWGSLGSATNQLNTPRAIKVNSLGEVHVADCGNHRIIVFNTSGGHIRTIGSYGSGDGQLNCPVGVDVDQNNNVYVAEIAGHRVQKFDRSGNFLMKFGSFGTGAGQMNNPTGVSLDQEGNIYVTERGDGTNGNRIQKFNPSGRYLTMFGSRGSANGQFADPHDAHIDKSGNIFVADSVNKRFQIFSPPRLTFTRNVDAQYLLVGGGGGGGGHVGGGGGAGGLLSGNLRFKAGSSYNISVGQGGEGGQAWNNWNQQGASGAETFIREIASSGTSIVARGGGGASAHVLPGSGADNRLALAGGSGGAASAGGGKGGLGTPGQGFAGGNASIGNQGGNFLDTGAGGGGAAEPGSDSTRTFGGAGGRGKTSSISGTQRFYAGGGGGGARNGVGAPAPGGLGGGAPGVAAGSVPSAQAGTGGGGGGGWSGGGAGASGTAIVRYPAIGESSSYSGWALKEGSGDRTLLGTSAQDGANWSLSVLANNTTVRLTAGSTNYDWTGAWQSGWNHWALVFDATKAQVSLYTNGRLRQTRDITSWPENPGFLQLGTRNSGQSPWKGNMAYFSIHSETLAGQEVATLQEEALPTATRMISAREYEITIDRSGSAPEEVFLKVGVHPNRWRNKDGGGIGPRATSVGQMGIQSNDCSSYAACSETILFDTLGPRADWSTSINGPTNARTIQLQLQLTDASPIESLSESDITPVISGSNGASSLFCSNLGGPQQNIIPAEFEGTLPAGTTAVPITLQNCTGDGALKLRLAAGSIRDDLGNTGPAVNTDSPEIVIDQTAPVARWERRQG